MRSRRLSASMLFSSHQMLMRDSFRDNPQWLHDIDIDKEYALIQKKISKLSRFKREVVIRMYNIQ